MEDEKVWYTVHYKIGSTGYTRKIDNEYDAISYAKGQKIMGNEIVSVVENVMVDITYLVNE